MKINNKNIVKIFVISIAILLVVSIINVAFVSMSANTLRNKVKDIKEANKPAEIEIFVIKTDCINCFDISPVVDSVKSKNVKILKEESLSKGSEFIQKYNIKKLPSIVILGKIDKLNLNGFEKVDNALVFKDVKAPYLDIGSNEVKGKVEVIKILDSSCDKCADMSLVIDNLKDEGVFISSLKNVEYNSAEGNDLIDNFGIKKVPALLISEEIDYYETIKQGLSQLNSVKKNKFYSMPSIIPPYRDLTSNKIEGLVDLIMLKDNTCTSCYDVQVNKQILLRFGMEINSEKLEDINSAKGKELISRYNIKKVPIIILSPEAGVYDSFVKAWQDVGTKETDGWFVMRKPEVIGNVKNL